jgi:hypothetical protein
MKFEVLRGKEVLMSSTVPFGGYPPVILKKMHEAGYVFRVDGKVWKPGKITNAVNHDVEEQLAL